MKKNKFISSLLILMLLLTGCSVNTIPNNTNQIVDTEQNIYQNTETSQIKIDASQIPSYIGSPYTIINDNQPYFTEDEITTEVFETYSELDRLGRCGVAYANICEELMPTEKRESISDVKPSGWKNEKYDFVDGGYVYNRCHLIGFQLAGENANNKNLITGTRYMNVDGMLPFENMVADYVKETGNHVLYRVTPLYNGNDLVAHGVEMEAYSVEDNGDGILFNVYCYNVQPGVDIDYSDGSNWETEQKPVVLSDEQTYVLNTKTKKVHLNTCGSVEKISEENKELTSESLDAILEKGYEKCQICLHD